jgi:hypothetical protein
VKRKLVVGTFLIVFAAGAALASWLVAGAGTASALGASMPTGATPTGVATGTDVVVQWAESFVAGDPVDAYILKRYRSSDEGLQIINTACAGEVAGLTCTEHSVPEGTWKYTVTPKQGPWLGTESAKSAGVVVTAGGGDTTPPAAPVLVSSTPASPSNNQTPTINGTAEANSTVTLYTNSLCSPSVAGTGTATSGGSFSISVTATANTTTTYYGTAKDAANNTSTCSSSSVAYTHDNQAPAAPLLTATDPASPANNNSPKVIGSGEFGSKIKLYSDSSCTSQVATLPATPNAADLAAGLTVSVANDSSTTFYATATDAALNASACSTTSVTYVEDSTPPGAPSALTTTPASPANNNSPKVKGTAAAGTATVKIYTSSACTIGSDVASGSMATFTGTGISTTVADNSSTTFFARGFDAAGNASTCSAGVTYVEDSAAPALTSLEMFDTPTGSSTTDGRISRVVATFNENLATYTAGTTPWNLANIPSSGSFSSVSVSGSTATLAINANTAIAPDTAVGLFTVQLGQNANGIRDAVGNLSSFNATGPADKAAPVPVDVQTINSGTAGRLTTGDQLNLTFSEEMSKTSILSTWTAASAEVTVEASKQNRITVLNESTNALLPLGSVDLIRTFVTGNSGSVEVNFTDSTIQQSGRIITITLGNPVVPAARGLATVTQADAMTWSSGGSAADLANNQWLAKTVSETGTLDIDF